MKVTDKLDDPIFQHRKYFVDPAQSAAIDLTEAE